MRAQEEKRTSQCAKLARFSAFALISLAAPGIIFAHPLPDYTAPITATLRLPPGRRTAVHAAVAVPIALTASRPFQTLELALSFPDNVSPGFFDPAPGVLPDACAFLSHDSHNILHIAVACPTTPFFPHAGLLGSVPFTGLIPNSKGLLVFKSCTLDGHPVSCDSYGILFVTP